MKYLLLAFISLSLLSCTPKKKEYFDFDQVDHYSITISHLEIIELYEDTLKSKVDSLKSRILIYNSPNTPANMSDLSFIDKLEEMGFQKTAIDKSKFAAIKNIFTEKGIATGAALTCEPFYRDILIFKKQNKVIGTAKLCFGCMQFDIIGTTANTEGFGENGDFRKLIEVLKK